VLHENELLLDIQIIFMRKLSMRFTVLLVVILFAGACANESEERAKSQGEEIWFEEPVHDFGDIPQGGDGGWTFVFKNVSEKAVVINRVRSTCGCTVPDWSKEPVEPGKKGKIEVIYNTAQVGTFGKSLYVYSTAANSPVRLQIRGEVLQKKK
jgi:hypothetical protein